MKKKIYSVRDAKGEVYHQPFYQNTHGEAERAFLELVKDERTFVAKYPEDYDLYYLGEFDDQKGTFESLVTPHHMMKATNLLQAIANKKGPQTLRPEVLKQMDEATQ